MSTDNREQLFPDVIEHYGRDQTPADDAPVSGGLDFPIPTESFADVSDELALEQSSEPLADEQDSVVQTELEPIDESSIIQTELEPILIGDDLATEQFAPVTAQAYSEWAPDPAQPQAYVEHLEPLPVDLYADAPDWVRAHIPREPLVTPDDTRGGFRSITGRLRVQKTLPAAPLPAAVEIPPNDPTGPENASDGGESGDGGGRTWGKVPLIGLAVAAVSVFAAGAVTVFTGDDAETPVPPLPESTASAEAEETTVAAPSWCATANEPDRIVGNGAGNRDSGPGVIQAFEHAYYVKRSGEAVASLMVLPQPQAQIQEFINAVPEGTEHCVTVLPTPEPNRWSVDVLLKIPPVGSEGIHRQWITTTPGDGGMKIATVEDRK